MNTNADVFTNLYEKLFGTRLEPPVGQAHRGTAEKVESTATNSTGDEPDPASALAKLLSHYSDPGYFDRMPIVIQAAVCYSAVALIKQAVGDRVLQAGGQFVRRHGMPHHVELLELAPSLQPGNGRQESFHSSSVAKMYPAHLFSLFPPFPRDNRVFVAMSFDPRFQSRYDNVIAPAIADAQPNGALLTPFRVDASKVSDSILTDILSGIGSSGWCLST